MKKLIALLLAVFMLLSGCAAGTTTIKEEKALSELGEGKREESVAVVNVTIMARDTESFRQSRTQVASDIARAVALGRRGM